MVIFMRQLFLPLQDSILRSIHDGKKSSREKPKIFLFFVMIDFYQKG